MTISAAAKPKGSEKKHVCRHEHVREKIEEGQKVLVCVDCGKQLELIKG